MVYWTAKRKGIVSQYDVNSSVTKVMTSHTLLLNTMYATRTEAGPLNRHQRARNGRTVKYTGWYNYFLVQNSFCPLT